MKTATIVCIIGFVYLIALDQKVTSSRRFAQLILPMIVLVWLAIALQFMGLVP